eukprot:9466274-Pyramimonas_sp.AAC.1
MRGRPRCAGEGSAASAQVAPPAEPAKRDLERGLLPGPKPKQAFGSFAAPTAEVRSRRAERPGLEAGSHLGER